MSYHQPPLQHPIPRQPFHPPEPPRTPANSSPATDASSPTKAYHPPAGGAGAGAGGPYDGYGGGPQQQQAYGSNFYNPNPAYSSGSMHQQPPSQHQPPVGQHQNQQQWNPMQGLAGSMGVNDATAQMGLQFGSQAFSAGQNYMNQTFTKHLPMPLLKHAFQVSNSYVLRKLVVLLWPWRHRQWARTVRRNNEGQGEGWASPREDLNAPDLYIPTMSIITYILLSALHSGLQSRFHPEVLGLTASKALGVVLLEFMGIKLGGYLLDVKGGEGGSAWEVGFYGGYKFVGIICCLLVDLLNPGRLVWWSFFLYVVAANAFFLLRSLKYILLPDPSQSFDPQTSSLATTITHGQRTSRVRFLVAVAGWQVFLMGALVWV